MPGITLGQAALLTVNLVIGAGADERYHFQWLDASEHPIDLTGWTGQAQIRDRIRGAVWGSFTVSLNAQGDVDLLLPHAVSEAWPVSYRKGVYDVELTSPGGEITRFIEGSVTISPDVTRTP